MLPNDQFGRTVTMVTQNGQDVYTANDGQGNKVQVSFPAGSPQSQAYNSLNGQAPPGYTPPAPLLSQTLSSQQFGQYIIDQFNKAHGAQGLTADQNFQVTQTLAPFFILAQAGDIETLSAEISKIPVDGVLITQGLINQFTALINGYLNGSL